MKTNIINIVKHIYVLKHDIVNESEHRALGDVKALEQLYTQLCKEYSKSMGKKNYYLDNLKNKTLYPRFVCIIEFI